MIIHFINHDGERLDSRSPIHDVFEAAKRSDPQALALMAEAVALARRLGRDDAADVLAEMLGNPPDLESMVKKITPDIAQGMGSALTRTILAGSPGAYMSDMSRKLHALLTEECGAETSASDDTDDDADGFTFMTASPPSTMPS